MDQIPIKFDSQKRGSCNTLEDYTHWILTKKWYKALIVVYKNRILGHLKLKWYPTFLSYTGIWELEKNYVYEPLWWRNIKQSSIDFKNNLAVLNLKENNPLILQKHRYIRNDIYDRSKKYEQTRIEKLLTFLKIHEKRSFWDDIELFKKEITEQLETLQSYTLSELWIHSRKIAKEELLE